MIFNPDKPEDVLKVDADEDGVGVDEWRGDPGIWALERSAARLGWSSGFFRGFAGDGCGMVDLEPEPAAHP